jgi:hypothetical protein
MTALNDFAKTGNVFFGKLIGTLDGVDARFRADHFRQCPSDPKDIGESNLNPLVAR